MSAKVDNRPRLVRLLIADPWRKLVAVGLAVLLWHYLDDQITDEREPTLRLETANAPDETGDKDALLVVVDRARYFVAGYSDLLTGARITEVQLLLRGDRHLIKDFDDESRGFRVTPSLDALTPSAMTLEFSVQDVRSVVPKHQELIVGMLPAAVRVELVENTRRDVPLNPQLVEFLAPPEVESRLLRDAAVFSTKAVWLLGPAPQVDALQSLSKIFVVEVSSPLANDTEATGTLRLINNPNIDKLRFADREPVTVTVPLRIPFRAYTAEVPYVLDQEALPATERGRFRPVEQKAEIEIEVSHTLEVALTGMNENDRRAWIWRHARLWVQLPPEATETDIYTPQFIIPGQLFEAGLDYRVVDLPPLKIERIP